MSQEPFDVTPIGDPARRGANASGLSQRERTMRRHAEHAAVRPPATLSSTDRKTGQPTSGRRMRLKPTMTVEEATAMVEEVVRRSYGVALAPEEVEVVGEDGVKKRVRSGVREQDRKHAATALGIAIDKWTMLTGRPTSIVEVREERAGLKALALRVLQGGGTAG